MGWAIVYDLILSVMLGKKTINSFLILRADFSKMGIVLSKIGIVQELGMYWKVDRRGEVVG